METADTAGLKSGAAEVSARLLQMQHLEQEAQALQDQGEWDEALQLCDRVLSQHPQNPVFTALRREFVLKRRQAVMELIRQLETQLRSEPRFEKRLELIGQALKRFPTEQYFKQCYSEANQALDQVRALASKAHRTADEGQFEEALGILDTISGVYSEYSPLDAERERIRTLQEKASLARKKARRVIGVRMALTAKDIEAARRELQSAFEEFSNDDELLRLQIELTQLENKTKEASDLYGVGCRQLAAEDYEAGIATLRQANRLDSRSRPIEIALFNALVLYAKLTVDFDHKRARHLLQEAAQLSPLNLTIESASKFLSDRILECALTDCRLRVQVLRDNGQIHDALKLVNALADRFQIHDDPLIEEIRSDIWIGFRDASGSKQEAGELVAQDELQLETRTESAWTVVEDWRLRERVRRTLQMLVTEAQASKVQIVKWRDLSRSAFSRLPKVYKLGAGVVGLLLIVATTVVSTSLRSQPALPGVASREPSTSSPASGNLKTGQAVEILNGATRPEELGESIHGPHATLGDATDKPVSLPRAKKKQNEEARIMRLANSAYAQGTYETSAEYSAQVLRINSGNLEARKLLDASRQAQKDLEAAITGR